jgi:hypothetical protein
MSMNQIPEPATGLHLQIGDASAIGIALGSLVGWLPAIAALLSIVWTLLRIWEMPTVQALVAKWRDRK